MKESLYQTADAGDTLSDRSCRNLSTRKRMHETLLDRRCRSLSIRHLMDIVFIRHRMQEPIKQRMQETVYKTSDAGVSLLDSGPRRYSNRQRMQESLYQTSDAGLFSPDSG